MNTSSGSEQAASRYRWVICALLFFATTSNYMDRQVLGILAPRLQGELGWSEVEYGNIVTAFQAAYALGLLLSGWLVDRLGARWGLVLAVALWSGCCCVHGLARGAGQFALARFGLGLAESANFPASVKSVSEWFPRRERALAIGIFNSGSNLGAVIAPLVVPVIALSYGWPAAFYALGFVGFGWVLAALLLFKKAPLDSVAFDGVASRLGWGEMFIRRETLAFALAKFLTDPVWWFYLYWTPKYLASNYQVDLAGIGLPLVIVYLCADVGSIGGGWWSGRAIASGVGVFKARMRVMLFCAVAVLSVVSLAFGGGLFWAVAVLGIATAAHQGWSANLFALVADRVPTAGVASVVGIGGMAGAIGGMFIAQFAGYILERSGSYALLFVVCGASYLVAWVGLWFTLRRVEH
jgi:ACS family hexuronate transporter-like MFS transporter